MDWLIRTEDQASIAPRGATIIAVTTVFLFLSIATTIARFYSRHLSARRIALEDWLILAGLIMTIITISLTYALVVEGGVGHQSTNVSPHQFVWSLKVYMVAAIMWATAVCLIKLSVLVFFVGIFTLPNIKWAVWVVIILTATIFLGVILQATLLCRPIEYTWDKSIDGTCGDENAGYMSIAIIELANEVAIVVLPMPVVWKLNMPTKKKIATSCVIAIGLIICALTAARIHALVNIDAENFTYTVVPDTIFAALELELGIVVANLPLLLPLMRRVFGSSGPLSVIWKRTTRDGSKGSAASAADSEKTLTARDRYYGSTSSKGSSKSSPKSSPHSSIDKSFRNSQNNPHLRDSGLYHSMMAGRGAPMRMLSMDSQPYDEEFSDASTIQARSPGGLESQRSHGHVPWDSGARGEVRSPGTSNEYQHRPQQDPGFQEPEYLQYPQPTHDSQGRGVAL